jgi:hypothetical protein
MNKNIFGIVPLAGSASRMKNLPKFLLPSKINSTLLEDVIELYHKNNIIDIVAGVSMKNNLLVHDNDNLDRIIVDTKTMAETVHKITTYIDERYTKNYKSILVMPDTSFTINDEMNKLIDLLDSYDIVTLLWKIKDYQIGKVGQCKIYNNEVVDVIDKDSNCDYILFWGCIGWNSTMNKYINPEWQTIGNLIKQSIDLDIKVGAIICEGDYYDCGTFEEYFKMIKNKI